MKWQGNIAALLLTVQLQRAALHIACLGAARPATGRSNSAASDETKKTQEISWGDAGVGDARRLMKCLLALVALVGCGKGPTVAPDMPPPIETQSSVAERVVSLNDFNSLAEALTYAEVVNIIGVEGEKTGEISIANGSTTRTYKWSNADGSYAQLSFNSDKLFTKYQHGLDGFAKKNDRSITRSAYDAIRNGMSMDEVINVVGSAGEQHESNEGMEVVWNNSDGSFAAVSLRNGRVYERVEFELD